MRAPQHPGSYHHHRLIIPRSVRCAAALDRRRLGHVRVLAVVNLDGRRARLHHAARGPAHPHVALERRGQRALLLPRLLARGKRKLVALLQLRQRRLDLRHQERVALRVERGGAATRARAPRAADAVHVVLKRLGQVHVDHVANALDVQPARRHVGGHQHLDAAAGEVAQRALALALAQPAVQRHRGDAVVAQRRRHLVALGLALHKHHGQRHGRPAARLAGRLLRQQRAQQLQLARLRAPLQRLRHVGGGRGHGAHLDGHRVVEVRLRQRLDLARHGGGEQQRLVALRQARHDLLDLRLKAHVEHAVRLVQHQVRDLGQHAHAVVHQVLQPPWGAHHDLHAAPQRVHLLLLGHAAVHAHGAHAALGARVVQHLVDLQRQLARGRHDERVRSLALAHHARLALSRDVRQHGQTKAQRLARPSGGDTDEVVARQDDGPALRLDGGRCLELARRVQHVGWQARVLKLEHGREARVGGRAVAPLHRGGALLPHLLHARHAHAPHLGVHLGVQVLLDGLARPRQLHTAHLGQRRRARRPRVRAVTVGRRLVLLVLLGLFGGCLLLTVLAGCVAVGMA
mmetsp:Transcript_13471/g.32986  ORF Transcript_13471/g.32986 Transcript_13471/m.32986 type:complete len:573 (-) Transcript_13471:330-2048(-)